MPEEHQQEAIKKIKKILASRKKGSISNISALAEKFAYQFLADAPVEYLSSKKTENFYDCLNDTFEFISNRNTKEDTAIRIFNPKWENERTVIQLLTKDVPFLIDSATAEINNSGLRVYEILHPVIKTQRTKDGKLKDILSDGEKDGKYTSESVIQFEITHISDESTINELAKNIGVALDAVGYAVMDWKKMLARIDNTVDYLNKSLLPYTTSYLDEVMDFFRWLSDNHFTFLGYGRYVSAKKGNSFTLSKNSSDSLGIFNFRPEDKSKQFVETDDTIKIPQVKKPVLVEFSKSENPSLVHRPVHMDYIRIKDLDKQGNIIGEFRFLGLFTSSVYYQSATLIPIIRHKIDYVLKRAGFKPSSHNGKELVTILETYPRDELFQIDEEQLFEICIEILELNKRPKVKMFVRKDSSEKFVSCIIFIPRERFNTQLREKIQTILLEEFGGSADDYYTQVTDSPLARLHVIVKTDTSRVTNKSIKQTERRLIEITNSWVDGLRETLIEKMGERKGDSIFDGYADAFPTSYINRYHFGGTYCDIIKIEDALKDDTLTLELYRLTNEQDDVYQLKIFHPDTQVTLSDILPILENMGFQVIDELTFLIEPYEKKKAWVHHFHLKIDIDLTDNVNKDKKQYIASVKDEFEEAFFKIWHKEIEDDVLNTLIVKAGLKWYEVIALRAYAKYIKQAAFNYSYDYVTAALSKHPILSRRLVELFNARFNPKISDKNRATKLAKVNAEIDKSLTTVSNVGEDRSIRQFVDIMQATLRTNFFQKGENGVDKNYISLKIDSKKVPGLTKPHPFREIFVYSYDIEGIHLRGGKVARGGLRWSDRPEDFRTEVLGLMKAQMVKNAVIVPEGSKGGFVVKNPIISGSRDEVIAQGIDCYKTFLKGMLDITDNIVNDKTVHPEDVVIHDDEDPYLVVAADKGTATFSDIANSLSEEYNFWLGDAFASGGSQGYDHKKMGITAKGAWVAVQRHFMEMGVDIQKEEFTVIGVGGMSGDVFGNGMLLSKTIKLIAAFGHSNIFIDPNPDPAKTYKERLRMFKLPRSTWSDYNKKLISKGGGIFDKTAKSIPISKEMKEVFDIEENSLSPDELIKKILKCEVDLMWNGGIGTYVKAESENHDDAGDRANDNVRINGKELRAKVVGEGGNLGLTQLGRIEYAANGGRVNTDFIDNSAGVDCSDHEVNIKIALGKAVAKKKLTTEKRNKVLADMTDEVADLVLRDNKLQTQAITISELQGNSIIESQMRLMKSLENQGLLDRKIEFLPDDDALVQRHALGKGLTRPELSTVICYSKISLYNDLINSSIPDDSYFYNDLTLYFPKPMRSKFENEIKKHQLRREIIATAIANSIVNRVGSEFFFHIMDDTAVKGCDVARAYTIVRDAFDIRNLWSEIEELDGKVSVDVQVKMFVDIKNFIERTSLWFIRNSSNPLKVSNIVNKFAPNIAELYKHLDNIISPIMRETTSTKYNSYIEQDVPADLAKKIANLIPLASACDIVTVASKSKLSIRVVGEIYFSLGTRLSLGWLRMWAEKLPINSYWDKLSQQTIIDNFYDQQRRLTAEVTKVACKDDVCTNAMESWETRNPKDLERYDHFLDDLKNHEKVDHSMLVIVSKRLETICRD